jgi:hypothetical protein
MPRLPSVMLLCMYADKRWRTTSGRSLAQEVLEAVRPGLQLHSSYDEAAAAVDALEAADAASQRARGGLAAIAEDEDAGDSGSNERSSAAGSDDEGGLPSGGCGPQGF